MNYNVIRFFKYGLSGGTAALLDFMTFAILLRLLKAFSISSLFSITSITIANTLGVLVGFICAFLLQKYWAFKSEGQPLPQLLMVGLLVIINIAITNYFIPKVSAYFDIKIEAAKIIMQILVVFWNFAILNFVVFSKNRSK